MLAVNISPQKPNKTTSKKKTEQLHGHVDRCGRSCLIIIILRQPGRSCGQTEPPYRSVAAGPDLACCPGPAATVASGAIRHKEKETTAFSCPREMDRNVRKMPPADSAIDIEMGETSAPKTPTSSPTKPKIAPGDGKGQDKTKRRQREDNGVYSHWALTEKPLLRRSHSG